MAEWLKAHAWKVCMRATASRVRIPLPPPFFFVRSGGHAGENTTLLGQIRCPTGAAQNRGNLPAEPSISIRARAFGLPRRCTLQGAAHTACVAREYFQRSLNGDAGGTRCVSLLVVSNRPLPGEINAGRASNNKADVSNDLSQQKQNCIRRSRMDHPTIGIENALMHHFRQGRMRKN